MKRWRGGWAQRCGLQGGQFGSIDVTAVSDALIEVDFGPDFDRLSADAARSLVVASNRWLDQLPEAAASPPASMRELIVILEGCSST